MKIGSQKHTRQGNAHALAGTKKKRAQIQTCPARTCPPLRAQPPPAYDTRAHARRACPHAPCALARHHQLVRPPAASLASVAFARGALGLELRRDPAQLVVLQTLQRLTTPSSSHSVRVTSRTPDTRLGQTTRTPQRKLTDQRRASRSCVKNRAVVAAMSDNRPHE